METSWNKEVLIRKTGAESEQGERGKMNRIDQIICLMSKTWELKNGNKTKNWDGVTDRTGV